MSTNARTTQKTDAQMSLIGIDAEGSRHYWLHHQNSVRVERPDGAVDHYGCESSDDWQSTVADQLGWARLHAAESNAELLAETRDSHLCLSCDETVDHRTWDDHVAAGCRVTLAPHLVFDR